MATKTKAMEEGSDGIQGCQEMRCRDCSSAAVCMYGQETKCTPMDFWAAAAREAMRRSQIVETMKLTGPCRRRDQHTYIHTLLRVNVHVQSYIHMFVCFRSD